MPKEKTQFSTNTESTTSLFSTEHEESCKESSTEKTVDKYVNFIKIKDDGKTEIQYIYHLSDIHIRKANRFVEYVEVFNRTYKKLSLMIGQNKKKSLIVLTGDIMHLKTE